MNKLEFSEMSQRVAKKRYQDGLNALKMGGEPQSGKAKSISKKKLWEGFWKIVFQSIE